MGDGKCVVFFSVAGETYINGNYEERDPGNTHVAATMLSEMLECPIFELVPKERYSRKYKEQVERAKRELHGSMRPELDPCPDISDYSKVYLCYPNWCGTIPMPVATFLVSNHWEGKTILPLCTNEGSGIGNSVRTISECAPAATIAEGISIFGHDVANCLPVLQKWAKGRRPKFKTIVIL